MVIFGEGRYSVTIPTELGRMGERHLLRKMLPSVFFLMRGFLGSISDVQNAGKRSKDRKVKTMPDYIERAAVEHMLEAAQIISDGEYCGYCTEDVRLSEIPSVIVVPRWDTKGYEGTTKSVLDCYYDITGDWNRVYNGHVTHWMPLPEPPEDGTTK